MIPQYVDKLFDNYCNSVTIIAFWPIYITLASIQNGNELSHDNKALFLKWVESIFCYDWGWIKLEILIVFPLLKQITIYERGDIDVSNMVTNTLFGESIISICSNNTFESICICAKTGYKRFYTACVQFKQNYNDVLERFKWKLLVNLEYVEGTNEISGCKELHLISPSFKQPSQFR
eukprot:486604_1